MLLVYNELFVVKYLKYSATFSELPKTVHSLKLLRLFMQNIQWLGIWKIPDDFDWVISELQQVATYP